MPTTIKASPPLSQSRYEDMACDIFYALRHVEGVRTESEPARRGSEVHRILATYINHLCSVRKKNDPELFAALLENASSEAQEALASFCETYICNHESIYGTEVHIALDAEFRPTSDRSATTYEATLDVIALSSPEKASIIDYKSFYQIIEPETYQSRFYPLLLMCFNPAINEVEFQLEFIRYGTSRSVTYTRDDLPKLKRMAQGARARQIALHSAEPSKLQALPGRHCTYCPKLTDLSCPISNTNPYGKMSPAERVAFAVWLKEASKENNRVLKDFMVEGGPISYRDGNDVEYRAEYRKQERKSYPLGASFTILNRWFEAHPGDRDLSEKLTVSGLSSPLKAKKREPLAKAMSEVMEVSVITKLTVGKRGEKDEEE